MGLKFAEDLNAWSNWQSKSSLEKRAKSFLANFGKKNNEENEQEIHFYAHIQGHKPEILFVLDSASPTSIVSLLRPALHLNKSYAVIAPYNLSTEPELINSKVQKISSEGLAGLLPDIKIILAAGHYLQLGNLAYKYAKQIQAEYTVIQHGLMTPLAPPLPKESTVLSFSEEDAKFWISGRTDIQHEVIGSQLFYEATQTGQISSEKIDKKIIFLGQMHGAELPRWSFALAAYKFCKQYGAIYRPHPSERDKLSLLTHKVWEKLGITIDRSGSPLNQSSSPVVSVFSTGVLEAAIRGVPAWVYHPNPPAWLLEFWDRYGMNQWGSAPTPAPVQPEKEPALAIAEHIAHRLEK